MTNTTINLSNTKATSNIVSTDMFGTNALHLHNVTEQGTPLDGFINAVDYVGVRDLRYPGGMSEDMNDFLADGSETALAPQLIEFLDWVKTQNEAGSNHTVTLGIPTKRDIGYEEVYNFAKLVGEQYGDLISAIEIGNEYSIGAETIDETTYGQRTNLAVRALDDGFNTAGLNSNNQPDIHVQMAEIFGHGSDYAGTGDHLSANRAIIDEFSDQTLDAIDGVVNHYYYIKDHQGQDDFANRNDDNALHHETRFLYKKTDAWNVAWQEATDRGELDIVFTEWNVQKGNADQLGLKSAGTLLQQFSYMVDMGVDVAHLWPLQHKTANSFAGNPQSDMAAQPSLELIRLLNNSLGNGDMRLLDLGAGAEIDGLNAIAFQGEYKTILYISSRSHEFQNVQMDLRNLATQINSVTATLIGYDPLSSDGLSEMGNAQGTNRVAKRKIGLEEYNQLKTLAFFDESNGDHITIQTDAKGNLEYLTYLPQFDDIIAKAPNPTGFSDYYFATENDVLAKLQHFDYAQLGYSPQISIDLDPYEVVEITINHASPKQFETVSQINFAQGIQHANQASAGLGLNFSALNMFDILDENRKNIDMDQFHDLSFGVLRADYQHLSNSNDTVLGSSLDDALNGGNGNDDIRGLDGNDRIFGGHGHDTLLGQRGDDTLVGGEGNDILTGGMGEDVFIFSDCDPSSVDIVTDFNPYEDLLVFSGLSSNQHLGRLKAVSISQQGDDTWVDYDGYTLILEGISEERVHIADFVFI